jgi:hypothetical protein
MSNLPFSNPAFFRYRGSSMWPCFQPEDLLVVESVPWKHLRQGDCIVYRKTGEADYIVHRIVALRPAMQAQGDARKVKDDDPILPAWIEGRVVSRMRNGHRTQVNGGVRGAWAGRFYRYAGLLEPTRNSKGGKLARLLRSVLRPISAFWMRRAGLTDMISNEYNESNYLATGNRMVAVYDEEIQKWSIVWPYSLLIDFRLSSAAQKTGERRLDGASLPLDNAVGGFVSKSPTP